jgi:hypothetical protein
MFCSTRVGRLLLVAVLVCATGFADIQRLLIPEAHIRLGPNGTAEIETCVQITGYRGQ